MCGIFSAAHAPSMVTGRAGLGKPAIGGMTVHRPAVHARAAGRSRRHLRVAATDACDCAGPHRLE